jgi:hypothetical protein
MGNIRCGRRREQAVDKFKCDRGIELEAKGGYRRAGIRVNPSARGNKEVLWR